MKDKKVLVIDDDADSAALLARVLEKQGCKVDHSTNVREGTLAAEKNPPHLVILDLNMPEEDGLSFLRRRHLIPVLAPVPFVVLSALSDSDSRHEAISLGAVDYVTKPFRSDLLFAKLRKAFRDRTFGVHTFSQATSARLTIEASLRLFSEIGVTLQSAAKIAPDTRVMVQNECLKTLSLETAIFQTSPQPARYSSQVQEHLSQVGIVGVTDEIRDRIRAYAKRKGAAS